MPGPIGGGLYGGGDIGGAIGGADIGRNGGADMGRIGGADMGRGAIGGADIGGGAIMVTATMRISGHLNPAVTVGLAIAEKFSMELVPGFIVAQLLGGIVGAGLVFLLYRDHYIASNDPDAKLATFATGPPYSLALITSRPA